MKGPLLTDPATRVTPWLTAAAAVHMLAAYSACALAYSSLRRLTVEDGLFENLSALYLMAGGILLLCLFRVSGRRNVFHLLLGSLFLFAFLEEISWGQRLAHLTVPQWFAERNVQGEINFHNLRCLSVRKDQNMLLPPLYQVSAGRLARLFWLTFCVAVPLLHRLSAIARGALDRMRVPIVPLSLGLLFVVNYLVDLALLISIFPGTYLQPVCEIYETNLGFLFLCVALIEWQRRGVGFAPQAEKQ
jgi:hypothetical protein